MKKTVALLAGCFLAVGHGEARAVTFTPDMWVYEVNLVPVDLVWAGYTAFADAPLGTAPPIGCTAVDVTDGPEGFQLRTEISCPNGTPEFDVIEAIGGLEQFSARGRIGFNSSTIVCDGQLLIGCPGNPQGGFTWSFTDIILDAAEGELSYCGVAGPGDFTACYGLSPTFVSVTRAFGNIGGPSGVWDFGFGGFWRSKSPDNSVRYEGTGTLVASPVPLPAPALMLGSALLAFGAFRVRGAGRRQKSQLER